MSKPVIYQFSIRFSRKDGKPISKRSKFHRACIELKERLIESGFEYVEVVPYRRHGIRGWIDGLRSPRTAMDSVRFACAVVAVVAVGLLIGAAR